MRSALSGSLIDGEKGRDRVLNIGKSCSIRILINGSVHDAIAVAASKIAIDESRLLAAALVSMALSPWHIIAGVSRLML